MKKETWNKKRQSRQKEAPVDDGLEEEKEGEPLPYEEPPIRLKTSARNSEAQLNFH